MNSPTSRYATDPCTARICLSPTLRSGGFTLVEILVALIISLLGAGAIMQIYGTSEAGKRAAGSLAEAQAGSVVALYSIERELQAAGSGFMHAASLGCILRSGLASGFDNRPLQPVSIVPSGASQTHASNLWKIPPGDAGSDMLAVASGAASIMAEGAVLKTPAGSAATSYTLSNIAGLVVGDYLLVSERNQPCTLTTVAAAPAANGEVMVSHPGAVAYSLSATVFHLGRPPSVAVFAVRNGTLTRCDFLVANCGDSSKTNDRSVWVPVANDVVGLRAQYGVDTASSFNPESKVVDLFCRSRVGASGNCSGSDSGLNAPGANLGDHNERACDWARIPIVRIALVMRSGQYESSEVTPSSIKLWPDSAVAPTTSGPEWTVPDRHYRYRVAASATALRNVVWMRSGTSPSC